MKEKKICSCCGKERIIFYNNMCQTCYREKKIKYRNWKLREGIRFKRRRDLEIVKMFLETKSTRKEIADKYKMTLRNVSFIISKFCVECDKNGNEKE